MGLETGKISKKRNSMNKLLTLNDFIIRAKEKLISKKFPSNSYVYSPDFESLYVRLNYRHIKGITHMVLDIANIAAEKPGNGAFKRLVGQIKSEHPDLGIYVENVLTPIFRDGLERMGFDRIDPYVGSDNEIASSYLYVLQK